MSPPGRTAARRRCRFRSRSAGGRPPAFPAGRARWPVWSAIGGEPSLAFTGGSPVPKGVCEYDVMGSIRGEPVDLVKCETVDLYVPATSEIVIEGYLQLDPKNWDMEGPFAEFTGYVAGDKSPKPTIRTTAI